MIWMEFFATQMALSSTFYAATYIWGEVCIVQFFLLILVR